MKRLSCVLSLIMMLQSLCFAGARPDAPTVFALPEAHVAERYEVDMEALLRDTYRMRLDSAANTAIFLWSFENGEMPPGLVVQSNGKIVGMLNVYSDRPYRFRVRIQDAAHTHAAPLLIDFSLTVAQPGVRLVSMDSGPRLVPVDSESSDERARGSESGERRADADVSTTVQRPAEKTYATGAAENNTRAHSRSTSAKHAPARRANIGRSNASSSSVSSALQHTALCDQPIPNAYAPASARGSDVYTLDARNGNLLNQAGKLVNSRQHLHKGGAVTIIVDNKNPYLYKYTFGTNNTKVEETEVAPFLQLIGGPVTNVLPAAPTKADAGSTAGQTGSGGGGNELFTIADSKRRVKPVVNPCAPAEERVKNLLSAVSSLESKIANVEVRLQAQREASLKLNDTYKSARLALYTPNRARPELYADSKALLVSTCALLGDATKKTEDGIVYYTGVNAGELDQLQRDIKALKRTGEVISNEAQAIREDFPECMKANVNIVAQLRSITSFVKEVNNTADEYENVRKKIEDDLKVVLDGREKVMSVLDNQFAFFDEHRIGGFDETTITKITFEATPVPNSGAEAFSAGQLPEFKFGDAPFFSLSGGVLFSSLQRKEYVRVQGFELDRAGQQVLVDGKPNLTTVVGLKEGSSTRIIPAVFLSGRLPGSERGIVDGVHMTFGVTAKNDNKGTDIEYMLGPSLSFFENKMFITVGAYAGKQQRLEGNLFEGAALPSTVTEIPIRKDYRWSPAFAISYRIPGLSK